MPPFQSMLTRRAPLIVAMAALLLAACSSTPDKRRGRVPHPELMHVPDATPRIEPLRIGGPNKPYAVLGRS